MLPKQQFPLQQIIPSLSASISRVAGNQAFSAYTQIIGSTGFDFILCGVYAGLGFIAPAAPAAPNILARVVGQVAKGGAGAEVVLGEWADQLWVNKPGTTDSPLLGKIGTHFLAPTYVVSGTRLAVRVWGNQAAGGAIQGTFYLFGYKATEWSQVQAMLLDKRYLQGQRGSDTKMLPAPTGAGGGANIAAGAGAFTYGAWVNVVAAGAVTKPYLITGVTTGIQTTPGGAGRSAQMQISTGAAGSEVIQDIVGIPTSVATIGIPGGGPLLLRRPIWVPPNAAASLRVASAAASESYDAELMVEVLR